MRVGDAPPGAPAGFVLVSVLWALVLIAGLSALFVSLIGMQLRSNAAIARGAAAEAMADGAIRLIAYRLATEPSDGSGAPALPLNGSWFRCQMFDGTNALVAVQDQDSLLDLNKAPVPIITRLFEAGLGSSAARRATQVVQSFRAAAAAKPEADPEGAAANRLTLGREGVFASPDELFGLIGVDGDSARRLLPFVTVYSQSAGIDPKHAPAALIQALGGRAFSDAADADLPPGLARPSRERFFSITAEVGTPKLGRSVRRAVVELVLRPERPFAVWEWGASEDAAPAAAAALPAEACAGAVPS